VRQLPTRALRGRAPILLAAASGWLALAVLASHLQGESAVEIAYLAHWAAAALLPLALAAPRPGLEIGATALLLNLVAWVVPPGPQRGAAFGLLLAAGVAAGAARLLACRPFPGRLELRLAPLAVAVQALFAAERLLAPSASLLWTDLAPAVLAGLALAALARRHGPAALVGGALTALVLGGLGPPTAGLLLLAAAADAWRLGPPRLRSALLAAAPGVLLALLPRGGVAFPTALLPLALLAPAALWPPPAGPTRDLWAGGWLLALAGAAIVGSPAGLAPALLLFALALAEAPVRLRLSGIWSAWLLGGAALSAGYPWLAAEPAGRVLAGLGASVATAPRSGALAAAVALAVAAVLAGLARRWPAATSARRLALLPALALAALGFVRPERPLLGPEPAVLSAENPAWSVTLDGPPPREVVVEMALASSGGLEPGTPVARIEVASAGTVTAARPLLAGIDVGDWAARRPDVAARLGSPPPTAWIAWVAPEATFFAQRYRISWRLPEAVTAAGPGELRLRLEPGLPPELTLALHRAGVRR